MFVLAIAILSQIPDLTYATRRVVSANDNMFQAYLSLGCWKDEVNNGKRTISSLEGKSSFLNGNYKVRTVPVTKCMQAALEKGFEVFAVQDGGQCFGSADAKARYKMAGSSNRCSSMKGGPLANDVYELSPLKKCLCLMPRNIQRAFPENRNCFDSELTVNSIKRTALHIAAQNGKTDCTRILIDAGAKIEARDKNQATPLKLAAWKKMCGPIKVLVSARAKEDGLDKKLKDNVIACSPERPQAIAQKKASPYEAVGCFKDGIPRVIATLEGNQTVSNILTGHYKTRINPVQKCYRAAKALKFKLFAVQDGGQCMSSATILKNYKNLGKSQECVSEKGGPMANYVWKIKNA